MPPFRKNYPRRKGYGKPYKSAATKAYRKYKPKKLSVNAVRSIAKAVVSKAAENKTVQFFTQAANIYPANSGSFISSIVPVSPYSGFLDIPQGVGQGERIGNRIKVKSIYLKGTIFPLPYNAATNINPVPLQIVFWFIIARVNPVATPTSLANFLQEGDSSRNLQNDLSDVSSRVNDDQFRLFTKRVFKLGYAGYSGTGTQPGQQAFTNNDFKLNINFKINLTKHIYKNLHYSDAQTQVPRNRGLFWVAQAIAADGSSLGTPQIPARMAYELSCDYEDM